MMDGCASVPAEEVKVLLSGCVRETYTKDESLRFVVIVRL